MTDQQDRRKKNRAGIQQKSCARRTNAKKRRGLNGDLPCPAAQRKPGARAQVRLWRPGRGGGRAVSPAFGSVGAGAGIGGGKGGGGRYFICGLREGGFENLVLGLANGRSGKGWSSAGGQVRCIMTYWKQRWGPGPLRLVGAISNISYISFFIYLIF